MEDSPQAVQKGDQDSSKQLSPGSVSTLPAKNRPGRRKRAFVLCQACCVDLKNLKTYYKRYRICIDCANQNRINIDGQLMRFCQQCGKFQPVDQFQGILKTCSQGLKVHAMRRRKGKCRDGIKADILNSLNHSEDGTKLKVEKAGLHILPGLDRHGRDLLTNITLSEHKTNQTQDNNKHGQVVLQRNSAVQETVNTAVLKPTPPKLIARPFGNDDSLVHPIPVHFGNSSSGLFAPELAHRHLQNVLSKLKKPTNLIIFTNSYPFFEAQVWNGYGDLQFIQQYRNKD